MRSASSSIRVLGFGFTSKSAAGGPSAGRPYRPSREQETDRGHPAAGHPDHDPLPRGPDGHDQRRHQRHDHEDRGPDPGERGARVRVPGTGKWDLVLRGDIGGFGIGSDLAWQVSPKVGYRFSKLFELGIASRVISMDYTGSGDPAYRYDMRIYGPEVGLGFHF